MVPYLLRKQEVIHDLLTLLKVLFLSGQAINLEISLHRLYLREVVLRILGRPVVVKCQGLAGAGKERLKIEPALPGKHIRGDEILSPDRCAQVLRISGSLRKPGKEQRRSCRLGIEVAEFPPRLRSEERRAGKE